MKYSEEYRNREHIEAVAAEIRRISKRPVTFMEVCGGHTMAIHRFGLPALLPENIRLLSGPGCPVCVSGLSFIDRAVAYARMKDTIVTTYGDLIRVPGSETSLEKEKAAGADIRIVYSVMESLEIARENPGKNVIFLGIGFETTAPLTAAAIQQADKAGLKNFSVLSAHKIMPPVMKALVEDGVKLTGFIAPGHVSAITGTEMYEDLPAKYGLGVVVSGFEPADLMQTVLMLVQQAEEDKPRVEIQYRRVVTPEGNPVARQLLEEIFTYRDDNWRGLGTIPASGLNIRGKYARYDAEVSFPVDIPKAREPKGCICGKILRGTKTPAQCELFATTCTPANPVGACMVSSEGTCATYYKYRS
jgi:hydrogenase expression/formation protein HypD